MLSCESLIFRFDFFLQLSDLMLSDLELAVEFSNIILGLK